MSEVTGISAIQQAFAQSRIRQEFSVLLETAEFVSFDVFDTLLRRRCESPAWVFGEVGRRASAKAILQGAQWWDYQELRIQAEVNARRASLREDVTLDEIFVQLPFSPTIQHELRMLELLVEAEVMQPDPIGLALYEMVVGTRPLYFISDMYLPQSFIAQLLHSHLPNGLPEVASDLRPVRGNVIVSSANYLTKASGSQFRALLKRLQLNPDRCLHVGDHLHADHHVPQSLGMRALHVDLPPWLKTASRSEVAMGAQIPDGLRRSRRDAALLVPARLDADETCFFLYGAWHLGPVLAGFARWIRAEAAKAGIRHILALMREGDLFATLIEQDCTLNAEVEPQRVSRCFVSRQSTFLPSIEASEIGASITQVFSRRHYTLLDLYSELGLGQDGQWIQRYHDVALTDLGRIADGGQSLLQQLGQELTAQQEQVRAGIARQRQQLNQYVEGLTGGTIDIATVDLGGGGTIPWQLSRALRISPIQNFLLYATERAFSRAPQVRISSFLRRSSTNRRALDLLGRSPEILEAVLVGGGGTTLRYVSGSDGQVSPVTDTRQSPATSMKNLEAFRAGVLHYQQIGQPTLGPCPDDNYRDACLRILERLLMFPESEEIAFLGGLMHDDNFGTSRRYPIIGDIARSTLAESSPEEFWRCFSRNPMHAIASVPWPQGLLADHDATFVKEVSLLPQQLSPQQIGVRKLVELLKSRAPASVLVYGAGEIFGLLLPELRRLGIGVDGVVDRKALLGAYSVLGYPVRWVTDPDVQAARCVVIASLAFVEQIRQDVAEHLSDHCEILGL